MATETMTLSAQEDALSIDNQDLGLPASKYLCLTILGYRKPGMSEEAYRRHMVEVSAPLTKVSRLEGLKARSTIAQSSQRKHKT